MKNLFKTGNSRHSLIPVVLLSSYAEFQNVMKVNALFYSFVERIFR